MGEDAMSWVSSTEATFVARRSALCNQRRPFSPIVDSHLIRAWAAATWMNCYDRNLRKIGPEEESSPNDLVTPPAHSRVNGWTLPLHSFQLIAWMIYIYLAIVAFGIYIPMLQYAWKYIGYVIIGLLFVYHLIVHMVAVSVDPADSRVRAKKNYNIPMPTLDRAKHPHVIQNQHCYLCEVDVGMKAKHCSTCNKCISDFDHHCRWLNNCVGRRNYRFFFHTVVSAVLGILLVTLVIIYVFVQQFVNPAELRTDPQFKNVRGNTWLAFLPIAPVETSQAGILTVAGITIILSLASLMLLGHLLCFHIYLYFKKLSTYEYVVRKRHNQEVRDHENDPESAWTASAQMTALQGLPEVKSQTEIEITPSSRSSDLKYQDQAPVTSRLSNGICSETASVSPAISSSHSVQSQNVKSKHGSNGAIHFDETKFTSERTVAVSSIPNPLENSEGMLQSDQKNFQGSHLQSLESIEEIPMVQSPLGSSSMDSGCKEVMSNAEKCSDDPNQSVLPSHSPSLLVNARDSTQLPTKVVIQQPARTYLVEQDTEIAPQRHSQ
ncbi:palmitoyltransferase ZDHHC11 isoform X2 [Narcine bancroftii]|uniref:palmitoyltransferase ZDHHC11 isoform X2 n=1 Tax=Narcine bancroftii TaxID=1343680 RepID=UPI0038312CBD